MKLLCIQVRKSVLANFMLQHAIIIIDMSELSYQINLLRIEGNKHVVPIEAPFKWQHGIIMLY